MTVNTPHGIVEDLSPIRFDKTPRPTPQWWGNNAAEVVRRGIDRVVVHYGQWRRGGQVLPKNSRKIEPPLDPSHTHARI
jgi:hypothetical protein